MNYLRERECWAENSLYRAGNFLPRTYQFFYSDFFKFCPNKIWIQIQKAEKSLTWMRIHNTDLRRSSSSFNGCGITHLYLFFVIIEKDSNL
jgi:hypothetical protein